MNLLWICDRNKVSKSICCDNEEVVSYDLKLLYYVFLLTETGQLLIDLLLSTAVVIF
jgi:hypothetical protein